MNRDRILSEINRQLQEPPADDGAVRPLGEVVGAVTEIIRAETNNQPVQATVPVWQVAAFVDGTLSAQEESLVVDAILADNSVLAEVVASLRSQQAVVPKVELSTERQRQLFELIRSQQPADLSATETTREVGGPQEELVAALPVESAASRASTDQSSPELNARSPAPNLRDTKERTPAWPMALLATAAAIVLLLGTAAFVVSFLQPNDQFVKSEEPGGAGEQAADDRGLATNDPPPPNPLPLDEETPESQSTLAQNPDSGSNDSLAESPVRDSSTGGSTQSDDAAPISPPPANAIASEAMPPIPNSDPQQDLLAGLRWKSIDGLVVQQASDDNTSNDIDIESSGNQPVWNRLSQSDRVLSSERLNQPTRIRTLPLSRGAIEIPNSESTLVVGPDSELRLAANSADGRTLNIELRHGAFAIPKVPFELQLRLRGYDRRLGKIELQTDSSVVFSYSPAGLQFDLREGKITVDDQSYEPGSHAFTRDGRIVAASKLDSAPRWTGRLRKELPRRVLDLVAEDENLVSGIGKRIQQLRSQSNSRELGNLAVLAQLQTALAGEQAPRLLASDIAVVRLAAMNRLASIPDWDPRYRDVWAAAEKVTKNQRFANQLKAISKSAREGRPLSARQIEALVTGMASRESASRAMSYIMLKSAFPQGPPFDPNWAAQLRTRSINAWRKNLGLPQIGNRAAAGNANP